MEDRPGRATLAAALPTAALALLFTLAALSSPHAHRASHAGVLLLIAGCLTAAAASWIGMRIASGLASRWRVPLLLYGLAVGLFFFGETIAVIVLNWDA